jgi:ketosteroid isomerase-like protein
VTGPGLTAAACASSRVAFVAALHLQPICLRFGSSPEALRSIGTTLRQSLLGLADAVTHPVRQAHGLSSVARPATDQLRYGRSVEREARLRQLYAAFNARDIDTALAGMTEDVDWPNAWEGGYVKGREEVRAYWTRQWEAVDSRVEPVAFADRPNGDVEVQVHQSGRDAAGNVLFDQQVVHVYAYRGDLVERMMIEDAD